MSIAAMIITKVWPWFLGFVWPLIRERVLLIFEGLLKEWAEKVYQWFQQRSRYRQEGAVHRASEAERRATQATDAAERQHYEATARVWREVAEMFRQDNERLKAQIDELRANAKADAARSLAASEPVLFAQNDGIRLMIGSTGANLPQPAETLGDDETTWELGQRYTRAQIAAALGGSAVSYLPMNGGKVVCGCFTYDDNPQLPDIILPGTRRDIEAEAAEFCKGYAVPVFVKLASNEWLHVGNYRVANWSTDPSEIERHQVLSSRKRTGRDKISQVLYLEPVGEYFDLKTMTKMTRPISET